MSRPAETQLPPVAETARLAALGDHAEALAEGDPTPRRFLDLLLDGEKYAEAARYVAFALPKREAVWWACRCARLAPEAPKPGDPGPASKALEAAERWVLDPSEENRREAGTDGEAAVGTPAGCAALSAFWSGGSLAPKGLPDVPPADDLTARGVAACVMLAGVVAAPEKAPERYQDFLKIGLDVASGADRWQAVAASPPQPPARGAAPAPPAKPPVIPATAPSPRPTPSTRFRDTWE